MPPIGLHRLPPSLARNPHADQFHAIILGVLASACKPCCSSELWPTLASPSISIVTCCNSGKPARNCSPERPVLQQRYAKSSPHGSVPIRISPALSISESRTGAKARKRRAIAKPSRACAAIGFADRGSGRVCPKEYMTMISRYLRHDQCAADDSTVASRLPA